MPLNDHIKALMTGEGRSFNAEAVRSEYKDNVKLWQLYIDLLELDGNKLANLIESHADEDPAKLKLRQQLAVCFNLVPTVVNMLRDYIFADEPVIDVGEDPTLKAFISNCDGRGTKYAEFVKRRLLPLAIVHGMVDVLVQNPSVNEEVITIADAQAANLTPQIFPISVLQRTNWSVKPSGEYNWLTFQDTKIEQKDPFREDQTPQDSHITLCAKLDGLQGSFWVRSLGAGDKAVYTGDFMPTARVPVATLFYQESLDFRRPHWPVSKIAMIAVLTKLMIQVLSWSTEDMLANLALLAMPGKPPVNDKGEEKPLKLSPFTILWVDKEAKNMPAIVQGNVEHLKAKLSFVTALVQEILRQAQMLGASAEAEKITSGVQGIVQRNELFQELATFAGGLDAFTYDVLALVKSWATGTDVSKEGLLTEGKIKVDFKKEGYTLEPLTNLIENAKQIIEMFRPVSPTMVEQVRKMIAREVLFSEESALKEVDKEIEEGTPAELAAAQAAEDVAGQMANTNPGPAREVAQTE